MNVIVWLEVGVRKTVGYCLLFMRDLPYKEIHELKVSTRAEPIVLKVLIIMLCCTAHEMCQLCSKMCLTDTGLIFAVHANGRSDCG